ncbi:MAG: hypothetical protein ACI9NT_002112 [Bacteroidia bacterium]
MLIFLTAPGLSSAADEIQQMLGVFQVPEGQEVLTENWSDQVSAARRLEYFGLSDPALFDTIEADLLQAYKGSSNAEIEYTGWMVKALEFSGQKKYIDTVKIVAKGAPDKRTRDYAKAAAEVLPSYTQWNTIISSKDNYRADKSAEVNRYANMLSSGVPQLQHLAAKRISFEKCFDE